MRPRSDIAARPVRRDLARTRIVMSPARGLAASDSALVAIGERIGAIGEGVRRRVDVEEKGPAARRVVAGRAVDGSTVEDDEGARGASEVVSLLGPRPCELLLGNAQHPAPALVVHAVELTLVAALDHDERPLLELAVLQVKADGHRRVVGVGPRVDVVMPLEVLAAPRPLEV